MLRGDATLDSGGRGQLGQQALEIFSVFSCRFGWIDGSRILLDDQPTFVISQPQLFNYLRDSSRSLAQRRENVRLQSLGEAPAVSFRLLQDRFVQVFDMYVTNAVTIALEHF